MQAAGTYRRYEADDYTAHGPHTRHLTIHDGQRYAAITV